MLILSFPNVLVLSNSDPQSYTLIRQQQNHPSTGRNFKCPVYVFLTIHVVNTHNKRCSKHGFWHRIQCRFLGDNHAQISLPFRLLSQNQSAYVSTPAQLGREKKQLSFHARSTIAMQVCTGTHACLHIHLRLG